MKKSSNRKNMPKYLSIAIDPKTGACTLSEFADQEKVNPNGLKTVETPHPEFTARFPFRRSIDKFDEQETVLWCIENEPNLKANGELLALAEQIKQSSATLDWLSAALKRTWNPLSLKSLRSRFVEVRQQNYEAINQAALRIFGDCGLGGRLSKAVQKRLCNKLKSGQPWSVPTN